MTLAIFITKVLLPITLIIFLVGIALFLNTNKTLFKQAKKQAIAMVLPFVVFMPSILFLDVYTAGFANTLITISFIVLTIMFADSIRRKVIVNLFQPLALNTIATILFIAGSVLSIVASIIAIFLGEFVAAGLTILLISCVDLAITWWIESSEIRKFENVEYQTSVFENGESGYSTFRLPVILTMPKDIINEKYGFKFENDPIIALAEGRKSSSKDLGNIDILFKISANKGENWSALKTAFSLGDIDGKMGNPTVVFDEVNAKLVFMYLQATKESGYKYETYCVRATISSTLDLVFDEPTLMEIEVNENAKKGGTDGVTENTLMVGPGKGVQVKHGEHKGRLIMPCSNRGTSFAMYSDDFGYTWAKSDVAGLGNENEVSELTNGEIIMVSRDNRGCTNPHSNCFQKLSYSNDGGQTWYKQDVLTKLPTPICMTSIEVAADSSLYLSYPHDHLTRANLSVATSLDNGENFDHKLIYAGPTGYSCLAKDTEGNLYCMAEVGKIDYNEMLAFVKL